MNQEVENAPAAAAEPAEKVTEMPIASEEPIATILRVDGGTASAVAEESLLQGKVSADAASGRLHIGSVVRIKVGDNLVYGSIRSVSLETAGR